MKKIILILFIAAILFTPGVIFADSYSLPFIMSSQNFSPTNKESGVKVEYDGNQYFGGMGANQTTLNFDPSMLDVGFQKDRLIQCINNMTTNHVLPNVTSCFLMSYNYEPLNLLTSKTEANGSSVYELAAWVYAPSILQGDVYSGFDNNNFAFYGRNNLNQTHNGADGPANSDWNLKNYTFNPEAQSSYSSMQLIYLKNHISSLVSQANKVNTSFLNASTWYLQGSNLTSGGNDQSSEYPDGKVWLVTGSNLSLNTDVQYSGKGTIIFMSNEDEDISVTLNNSRKLLSDNNPESSLGIIVIKKSGGHIADTGAKLTVKNNTNLRASVLILGNMEKLGSGTFYGTGSFVANDFLNFSGNGFSKFTYDFRLKEEWPPGFRYFSMPTSKDDQPE